MFQFRIADRLLVSVLFVIMSVFSTVTIINLRANNAQTVKLRESIEISRVLSEASIFCTLDTSGAVNTGVIEYTPEAIKKYVNECISKEAAERNISLPDKPIPTTTTTETVSNP